jgi:hypothetical protein
VEHLAFPAVGERAEDERLAERARPSSTEQAVADELDLPGPRLRRQQPTAELVHEERETQVRTDLEDRRIQPSDVRLDATHPRFEEEGIDADVTEWGSFRRHCRAIVRLGSALVPAVDERMIPDATIVIVTHNRREAALRAVASALSQTAPVEVLVFDDGSTNGTSDSVREAYLEARVERFDEPAEIRERSARRRRRSRRGSAPGRARRRGSAARWRAILEGYRTAFAERRRREPVTPELYRAFRRLGFAPERLEEIEPVLVPLAEPARAQDRVGA